MTKTLVIVGGSFAGINVAHVCLKRILKKSDEPYKVIMISPSTHFFFTFAGPRALVEPDIIDGDKLFLPIVDAFSTYGEEQFQFIQGTVSNVDLDRKEVAIEKQEATELQVMNYDIIIIASGATTQNPVFKLGSGSHELLKNGLHELAKKIEAAQTIAIGGAGALGVELSGDIAQHYITAGGEKKHVILFTGRRGVLPALRHDFGEVATDLLKQVKVEIVQGLRVVSSSINEDKTSIKLSDGSEREVDLYISCSGETPNTSFLPKNVLTSSGYIAVDGSQRIKGYDLAFAIGDVADGSDGTANTLRYQFPVFEHALKNVLAHGTKEAEKILSEKQYSPEDPKGTFVITVGKLGGVAAAWGIKLPSWIVKHTRAKNMGLNRAPDCITGRVF